jgi:plastocyanin
MLDTLQSPRLIRLGLLAAAVLGVAVGALSNQFVTRAQEAEPQNFTVLAGGYGPANIEVLAFAPQSLQVHRGDTVTWVNNGFHNIHFANEPAELVVMGEVNGEPVPQLNPGIAFPTIESGSVYQGGDANSGLPMPGVSPIFSLVIDLEPGAYSFLCDIHPGMAGVINVVADDVAIASPAEVAMQAAGELGGAVGAGMGASMELEAQTFGDESIYSGQVNVGSANTGRVTVNQFFPFVTVIKAGESVTWNNLEGGVEPHLVGWPPVRGQDVAPIEVEGGPPILAIGPTLAPITPDGSSIAPGQAFNSGLILPGQSYTLTFTEPGVYPYTCNIHPAMNGTVIVEAT